jgi:hypothetical protein
MVGLGNIRIIRVMVNGMGVMDIQRLSGRVRGAYGGELFLRAFEIVGPVFSFLLDYSITGLSPSFAHI